MHDAQDRLLPARAASGAPRCCSAALPVRELPLVLHRPDGSVRRVLLTARALRTSADAPAPSCLVSFRDITEQHALRWRWRPPSCAGASRSKAPAPACGTTTRTAPRVFYSPGWKRMLGYAEAEISARSAVDAAHPPKTVRR